MTEATIFIQEHAAAAALSGPASPTKTAEPVFTDFGGFARVGPTTPTRAGRFSDASVDQTEARKTTVRRFGRSNRRALWFNARARFTNELGPRIRDKPSICFSGKYRTFDPPEGPGELPTRSDPIASDIANLVTSLPKLKPVTQPTNWVEP